MRRREFIAGLGGAAAWPFGVSAQQSSMPVIGFVNGSVAETMGPALAAFRRSLNTAGFVEGRNVGIEFRWGQGDYRRLPAMMDDLVARQVAVIVAGGNAGVYAAKAAKTTIPLVFSSGTDPLRMGLVSSLSRPGGNITGVFILTNALEAKRLQLLHEVVPATNTIGVLVNAKHPDLDAVLDDVQAAARGIAKRVVVLRANSELEIDAAFTNLAQQRIGALLVTSDPYLFSRREQIVTLANHHKVPAIYQWREYATSGGLMSYGTTLAETYRTVGLYVGRILKGEKAGDLPVVQSDKIEFVINLKTAKALGLTIPLPLLGRADEVIE